MKKKLALFTSFANALYPHEIEILNRHNNLEDQENIAILARIYHNNKYPEQKKSYDPDIDKRKYSNLKKWIEQKLSQHDVDQYFEWLIDLEKKILTDSINPDEEKRLLRHLKHVSDKHYHFTRLYETIQHFRDYLLIRMRITYYKPVSEFLDKYRMKYLDALEIHTKLNDATFDIITQQSQADRESKQWESYLQEIFRNENLDAYTRYRAVVRLMYLYYNYHDANSLKNVILSLEKTLSDPAFYSKRILANYYANRSLMHQKLIELEDAEKYGYLSIRQQNNDYLFYVNNLCGVLIKRQKYKQALRLMQGSIPYLKQTNNMFNRVGFAALYVKNLAFNGKHKEAASYAETFRDNYKNEIFQFRWHLFYEAYLLALIRQGKYRQMLQLINRNDLIKREKKIGRASCRERV